MALERYLLSLTPQEAEENWWLRDKLGRSFLESQWFEIRADGVPPYYLRLGGGSGRQSANLPTDIAPTQVKVVTMPSPPSTTLRDYLKSLCDLFDDKNPEDRKWRNSQVARIAALRDMYDADYTQNALVGNLGVLAGAVDATNFFEATTTSVMNSYSNFLIHGVLAGELSLAAKVLSLAEPFRYTFEPLGYGLHSLVDARSMAEFLLNVMLHHDNGVQWIVEASTYMQQKGEGLQESALGAETVGQFYGSIFSSAPWLHGAGRGFGLLASLPIGTDFPGRKMFRGDVVWAHELASLAMPETAKSRLRFGVTAGVGERAKISFNICSERMATAAPPMECQFADSLDHRDLLNYRELIEERRRVEGESAADELADEVIELKLLYPRFAKAYLLGRTDWFPNKKSAVRA